MTIIDAINYLKNHLSKKFDQDTAQQYAWWLVEAATEINKALLMSKSSIIISHEAQLRLNHWLDQIINHDMPLDYAIGYIIFAGCRINIRPPILIPRPETEQWVIELIEHLQSYKNESLRILDMCTGSGCIAITLAHAFKKAHIIAVDISSKALLLAQENANLNKITNISFLESDLFTAISDQQFDLIVSNPPYISPQEWQTLDISVKSWEDPNALIAQNQGLALIEQIITQAPQFLSQSVIEFPQLVVEMGYQQGPLVKGLMQSAGYQKIIIKKDYSNHDRVAWGSVNASIAQKT